MPLMLLILWVNIRPRRRRTRLQTLTLTLQSAPSHDGGNVHIWPLTHMTSVHEQITSPITMPYLPTLTDPITLHLPQP